ncbi:MAG: hypothetical protein H6808_10425 [Phycisphaera sp.]|nr:hypothetical protein [Phycisphaera sp.]
MMSISPFQPRRTLAIAPAVLLLATQASAQSVSVDVVAPSSVAPGETFVAAIRAAVSPSSSIHAVAGIALDFEVQSGQDKVDSLSSPSFLFMTDGTRVSSVGIDAITGIVAGQWANIAGSNPDLSTANPITLCTIEVTVSPTATVGETIQLIAANPHPAGGVFLYDDANPLQIVAAPNDAGTSITFNASTTMIANPCLADVNGDGVVSPADFSAWVGAFNTNAPGCDQNGDGACTPADFSAWVSNYNMGC